MREVSFVIHIPVWKFSPAILATPEFHLFELIQNDPRNLSFNVSLFAHGTRGLCSERTIRLIRIVLSTSILLHAALAKHLVARRTHGRRHPDQPQANRAFKVLNELPLCLIGDHYETLVDHSIVYVWQSPPGCVPVADDLVQLDIVNVETVLELVLF